MTEKRPVEDKHGRELKTGDVVEFVYGGDHHRMTIDELKPDPNHPDQIVGTITVHVHAGSCARVKEAKEAKTETKSSTKGETKNG